MVEREGHAYTPRKRDQACGRQCPNQSLCTLYRRTSARRSRDIIYRRLHEHTGNIHRSCQASSSRRCCGQPWRRENQQKKRHPTHDSVYTAELMVAAPRVFRLLRPIRSHLRTGTLCRVDPKSLDECVTPLCRVDPKSLDECVTPPGFRLRRPTRSHLRTGTLFRVDPNQ